MSIATKRKTSFEIDFVKLDAARAILGTKSMTDTIDAALDSVVKLQQRRRLVDLLFTPGAIELDNPDVMSGAWR